jgi:hypothetical protein
MNSPSRIDHRSQLDDPLVFFVEFSDGSRYKVDLREFAVGGNIDNVVARARHSWAGDFAGRPTLAEQFAEMISEKRPQEISSRSLRHGMRAFFRFLDEEAAAGHPEVFGIQDITDAHGPAFLKWLGTKHGTAYRRTKTALDAIRELRGLPALFWPARAADPIASKEPVAVDAVRHLFNAFKHEARSIKQMFAEGEQLAAAGRDPREPGPYFGKWSAIENRARVIKDVTAEHLLDRQGFKESGIYWPIVNTPASGPSYLAPGMGERGREGIVGALRWFYPSYQDMAVFLWLFLLGTGWNLSTALSIDVTSDETWHEHHPHNPKFVVIHAFKARADRHQFTLSMIKPEWHPYQIIRYVSERTRILRATVQRRLDFAVIDHANAPSSRGVARIAELRATLRSPWLYHLINKTGEVSAFGHNDAAHFGPLARTVARKHGLTKRFPSLERISTSDARDAWIGYAYVQSGYHVLLTQLAGQHKNVKTLKHYLKSRRYRMHSELQVRKVQDTIFAEISDGRVVDPTRLRLIVARGLITEEQERRLSDLRQRTRLGMGCLDPMSPPRNIAPEHKAGTVCRVQRCTGCRHGVVFAESLIPLGRACAELIHLQRTLPYTSWSGSTLEEELASLEETLKSFDAVAVRAAIDEWLLKLETQQVKVHDTYPSY